eukprot:scaffold231804_cov18-Prasinocladus_malaysianus.AAC.1
MPSEDPIRDLRSLLKFKRASAADAYFLAAAIEGQPAGLQGTYKFSFAPKDDQRCSPVLRAMTCDPRRRISGWSESTLMAHSPPISARARSSIHDGRTSS